jgi:Na+/H+ antiporter
MGIATEGGVWLLVGLLGIAIPLVAFARRINVAYPIVLVAGGLVLGFIPGLPRIDFDPALVLVIFLPPLLFWESVNAPTDVMRANARWIASLAIGLVLATSAVVAVVAHSVIATLAWPMAFVLGAIVAPTDELASAPVLERMRIPRRLVAIVEGESLLNDAASLIVYGSAVTAAVTGTFAPLPAVLHSVVSAIGGVALGIVCGWLAVFAYRRIVDTELQGIIAFVSPFFTYVLADRLGVSGVLAVVFMAVYGTRYTPVVITPYARLRATGFWDSVVFLANALLFLLVGLQLHELARIVHIEYSWPVILWYAFVVNASVVVTRFGWYMLLEYLPNAGEAAEYRAPNWRNAVVACWSGLRGAVSLAAALAIPASLAGGGHLPHRNLVIFLALSVILVTLVGGGLTLPLVIRRLKIPQSSGEDDAEMQRAHEAMVKAALSTLDESERRGEINADDAAALRRRYGLLHERLKGHDPDVTRRFAVERKMIESKRRALITAHAYGEIDNTIVRRLQLRLDLEYIGLPTNVPSPAESDLP